jgi:hypothetical protein
MSKRNLFDAEMREIENGRWLGDPMVPLLRKIIAKLDDLDIAVNGMPQVGGIWDRIEDIEHDIRKLEEAMKNGEADSE